MARAAGHRRLAARGGDGRPLAASRRSDANGDRSPAWRPARNGEVPIAPGARQARKTVGSPPGARRMNDHEKNEDSKNMLADAWPGPLEPDETADLTLLADLLADPSTWAEPRAGLEDEVV